MFVYPSSRPCWPGAKLTRHQCSQTDLICIALVSKHFHELASAQLYRNFHIIFPDDDDHYSDSPIDGLAGGLDTFTTSDYNYTQHLRDLSLDTLSAGVKGELSYQSYLYSSSCGKFLNSLLYLTLKKAKSLEAFKWNIRVELSRQVYRELHRIPSLKKLHIRMQAGESYYVPPPPLPVDGDSHVGNPPILWPDDLPPSFPPATMQSTISLPLTSNIPPLPSGPPPALVPPSKSLPKSKLSRRGSPSREPTTLSGFHGLRSLSILDIDDLDIVAELKTCIQNSAATLNTLQLSLSDHLASQARKPPPDSDPDDSDIEDEFHVVPTSHSNNQDGTAPAKAFRAQEERKIQEAVLSRIFDVDLPRLPDKKMTSEKTPVVQPSDPEVLEQKANTQDQNADEQFIASLRSVSDQLMTVAFRTGERTSSHQEILETIEKAARKYVDSATSQNHGECNANRNGGAESLAGYGNGQEAGSSSLGASQPQCVSNDANPGSSSKIENSAPSAVPKVAGASSQDDALDEIDMEHVDNTPNDAGEEFDDQTPDAKPSQEDPMAERATSFKSSQQSPAPNNADLLVSAGDLTSAVTDASTHDHQLIANVKFLQSRIESFKDRIRILCTEGSSAKLEEIAILEQKIREFENTITDIGNQLDAYNKSNARVLARESNAKDAKICQQQILNYLKETRGFALETLGIHLIPVKASVLSRAVDLRSLKQLTLLNVGNQAPIWTLLSKENKVQPLPLRKVFTDNVSDAFLACISQLEELHDLFLLERSAKSKPESFAPRSSNTIDQIRRVVLAKHMPTLKRLMIKDESSSSSSWDANEKTMVYMCTRGKQLEELAITLNIQAVVSTREVM